MGLPSTIGSTCLALSDMCAPQQTFDLDAATSFACSAGVRELELLLGLILKVIAGSTEGSRNGGAPYRKVRPGAFRFCLNGSGLSTRSAAVHASNVCRFEAVARLL